MTFNIILRIKVPSTALSWRLIRRTGPSTSVAAKQRKHGNMFTVWNDAHGTARSVRRSCGGSRNMGCVAMRRTSPWSFLPFCDLLHFVWANYSDLTRPGPPISVAFGKGNGTPYFRKIEVGEILFHLARFCGFFFWGWVFWWVLADGLLADWNL